jgi:hypothetical protein
MNIRIKLILDNDGRELSRRIVMPYLPIPDMTIEMPETQHEREDGIVTTVTVEKDPVYSMRDAITWVYVRLNGPVTEELRKKLLESGGWQEERPDGANAAAASAVEGHGMAQGEKQ